LTSAGFKEVKGALTSYLSIFSVFDHFSSKDLSGFRQEITKQQRKTVTMQEYKFLILCSYSLKFKSHSCLNPSTGLGPDISIKRACVENIVSCTIELSIRLKVNLF